MATDVFTLSLLSVVNWLHLVATVVWIGGMATNALALLPSIRESLEPPVMGRLLGSLMKRFRRLVYISILLLVVTGVVMTVLNEYYLGPLSLGNLWTIFLWMKHILVAILIILAIYSFEVLAPKVGRAAAKGPSPELAQLQKSQLRGVMAGLIIGFMILFFTAVTTAISALP